MPTLLETIQSPQDLQMLNEHQLKQLCEELRATIIETVSKNGGHLASNLGVVELTVALHHVMNCPQDTLVFDVGHQCYSHKLLTGRYQQFSSLRKEGGITGFPNPNESEYDPFIAGHSSTAISVASGIAKAKRMQGDTSWTVAIVGDGAMTGGLSFEGLSNAGINQDKLIVILNDNHMSINNNVGFVARHLANLRSRSSYIRFKRSFSNVLENIPLIGKPIYRFLWRMKRNAKYAMYEHSSMFEDMGFYYLGPINGHDLEDVTESIKAAKKIEQPVLIHLDTVKGMGYAPAMNNPDIFHGIGPFDIETGKTGPSKSSFSSSFGKTMLEMANQNDKVVAITAAMTAGTGLSQFAETYPDRFFDVGIAEEHAITFASAMATKGQIPVVALYSTFLQRTYDQLLNDTAIMNNHIVLAIDRAGIVPDDGITHQGIFDIPMLNTIPKIQIFAPSTYSEQRLCLKQAAFSTNGPAVVRYPKGEEYPTKREYKPNGSFYTLFDESPTKLLAVTYGRVFSSVFNVYNDSLHSDKPFALLKLTRIKPITDDIISILKRYDKICFFEEASVSGGVGEKIASQLILDGYSGFFDIQGITSFIDVCKMNDGLKAFSLDEEGIATKMKNL